MLHMEPARGRRMSVEEYFAFDASSEIKHEYVNGELVAMAGAEPEHNAIRDVFVGALARQLAGRPCLSFSADQRVRISETGVYAYPDIVVVCGRPMFDDAKPRSLLNPQVIVEVLSPSTELYDRVTKFSHYQRLPSIQEYVLVSTTQRRVDHYARSDGSRWTLTVHEETSTVELPTLEANVPLDEIYGKMALLQALP